MIFYLFSIQVDSLKLKNLCNERTTKDEHYVVNSYYRLKMNKTLPSIGFYLPIGGSAEKIAINSGIKELVKEIYSERFMNSTKLETKIQEKQSQVTSLKDRSSSYGYYDRERYRHIHFESLDNINFLLTNLSRWKENYLTEQLLNAIDLGRELKVLRNSNENQSSTFKDEFIDIFYEMPLVTLDGFRVHRAGPIFLDRSSYGTLHFSLYVPFYDKTQTKNLKVNCSCTDYLPKFYTIETSPVAKNGDKTD